VLNTDAGAQILANVPKGEIASKGFIGQMADMVYKSGANVLRQAENAFM
jgi:hypothetical protein